MSDTAKKNMTDVTLSSINVSFLCSVLYVLSNSLWACPLQLKMVDIIAKCIPGRSCSHQEPKRPSEFEQRAHELATEREPEDFMNQF